MRLESEGASGECVDFGETFADLWMRNTKGNRVQAEGPLVRPQAHTFSLMGNDAPTTAREWDLPSHGASTLFFRWRKKSMQKKASGTATPGKSLLLPIFERGSSQCRAQHSWIVITYNRARSCSLFSSFKKGKAFSLRCLSPPLPPQLEVSIRKPCSSGCYSVT